MTHEWKSSLAALTPTELREQLQSGIITSRKLVDACLSQIQAQNKDGTALRAMISVLDAGKAMAEADKLDQERSNGSTRAYFHGIPIVVKDTINTSPDMGMATTMGAPALLTAEAQGNARLAEEFMAQGLIIPGKTNLSARELGATKSSNARAGYSPDGGQTQSAYIDGGVDPDDTALGHTADLRAARRFAVAAACSPLSTGAETDGSIITPAIRSLYALKSTHGRMSREGIFTLTASLDSIGGMAKVQSIIAAMRPDLKVGFVDPDLWQLPTTLLRPSEGYRQQTLKSFHEARSHIERMGARVVCPVELAPASSIKFEGKSGYCIIRNGEFKPQLNQYLESLKSSPVRSLREVISFNEQHPDLAFIEASPDQDKQIAMENDSTSPEFLQRAIPVTRQATGPDKIDKAILRHDLDAIILPGDRPVPGVTALAGYPIGTMPLGYLKETGRPFSLCIVATANDEDRILAAMSAWEN